MAWANGGCVIGVRVGTDPNIHRGPGAVAPGPWASALDSQRFRRSMLPFTVVSGIRGPPGAPTWADRLWGSIRPCTVIGESLFRLPLTVVILTSAPKFSGSSASTLPLTVVKDMSVATLS